MSGVYQCGNSYIVRLGHNGQRLYFGSHPTQDEAVRVAQAVRKTLGPKKVKRGPEHHSYKHGKRCGEYDPKRREYKKLQMRGYEKKKLWPVVRAWPYAEEECGP